MVTGEPFVRRVPLEPPVTLWRGTDAHCGTLRASTRVRRLMCMPRPRGSSSALSAAISQAVVRRGLLPLRVGGEVVQLPGRTVTGSVPPEVASHRIPSCQIRVSFPQAEGKNAAVGVMYQRTSPPRGTAVSQDFTKAHTVFGFCGQVGVKEIRDRGVEVRAQTTSAWERPQRLLCRARTRRVVRGAHPPRCAL